MAPKYSAEDFRSCRFATNRTLEMVVNQAGEAGSYFVIDTYWVWGPGPSLGQVRSGCGWPLCSRCHFVSADGRRQCWAGQATAEVASSFLHYRQAAVCRCPLCELIWMIIWKQLRMHAHLYFTCVIFFLHEGDGVFDISILRRAYGVDHLMERF